MSDKAILPQKPPAPYPVWPVSPAEVWLAAGNQTPGTGYASGNGTLSNPYWGDLDYIAANLPDHSLIHLGPGDFWTAGLTLKAWQRWKGAGMRVTRVHLTRAAPLHNASVMSSDQPGITIEDMTLDANGQDGDQKILSGCSLYGDHITMRRVLVVNAVGNWALGMECFPIFIGLPTGNALSRNLISECEVSICKGDYIAGISLDGQGVVEKCRVELPVVEFGRPCGFTAYQSSGAVNTLFLACASEGGCAGYYSDTYSEINLSIRDCWFRNVLNGGIVIEKAPGYSVDGVNLDGNVIEFSQNAPTGAGQAGITILTAADQKLSNLRINGQAIRYVGGFARENTAIHIADHATGVQIGTNAIASGMRIIAPANQQ